MPIADNATGPDGTRPRLAVIVPANAEPNPGDRALVWEGVRFLREGDLADEVVLLNPTDDPVIPDEAAQPEGCRWVPALLRPPRRGRSKNTERLRDRPQALLGMIFWAALDFLRGELVTLCAPWPWLARLFLSTDQVPAYRAIHQAELIAVKGGGFLHADPGLRLPYHTWWMLFYFRLAQRLRKPVVVLPNSFGPFGSGTVRRQMRRTLAACRFLSARETFSAEMLSELIGRPVPVYPDHGYYLEPAPQAVGEAICRAAGVPLGEKPCFGFTVRPHRFVEVESDKAAAYDRFLDAIAELAREVARRGYHPVLITHSRGPTAHENDRVALQAVHDRLSDLPHSWVDHSGNCREVKAIYGCLDYLVGTRFHSVIFAQALGVPCLAIAYSGNKAQGIMNDMGLGEYVLPIAEVSFETLKARLEALLANEATVRERMAAWLEQLEPGRAAMMTAVRDALAQAAARR